MIFLGCDADPSSALAAATVQLAAGRMLPDEVWFDGRHSLGVLSQDTAAVPARVGAVAVVVAIWGWGALAHRLVLGLAGQAAGCSEVGRPARCSIVTIQTTQTCSEVAIATQW